ncbi:MAG: alpha/beta hydrolase [Acidobacteria bacterium]|nr:MAG: alpha/beta hydrolase [Acidobacteriota bacterium]
MPRRAFHAASAAGSILAASTKAFGQTAATPPAKTGYAPVNGLKLYYEIHGNGDPLVLLHGGLGSMEIFGELLPVLAKTRRVLAADLQAHGRAGDIDRPISYEALADDIAGLMKQLGIEKADVMGYSLGAGTALQTTIRHSASVRKLVVVSTVFKRNGWYPEILAAMAQLGPAVAEQLKQSPLYQAYARTAPKPENWPVLVTKMGDLLRKDFDWSKDVAAIQAPTMLVFGDADSMHPEHVVEFFQLLGGGKKDGGWDGSGISNARLAILPGVTHYNLFSSPALAPTVLPFLDAPMPAVK